MKNEVLAKQVAPRSQGLVGAMMEQRAPSEDCCAGSAREMTPDEIGARARAQALLHENGGIRAQLKSIESKLRNSDFAYSSESRRAAITRIQEAEMWLEREAHELSRQ